MTYIIAQPCVDILDKGCIEECPVDCIYEGERMLYIHPDECVDCGACVSACPVGAIAPETRLEPRQLPFVEINASFYPERRTDVKLPPRAEPKLKPMPERPSVVELSSRT